MPSVDTCILVCVQDASSVTIKRPRIWVNMLGLRAVSDLPDEFDRSQSAYKRKCKTVLLHQQTEIPPTTTTQVLLSDGDERQTKIGS